jgi:Right handed beta helix region
MFFYPSVFRTVMPIARLLCCAVVFVSALAARELHVAEKGDDSNDGLSAASAFRSLAKAASVVQPGDTVLIGDGVYTDADRPGGPGVVTISASGRPDAWITWKPRPGAKPEIRPVAGWAGITITGSYHILDGLTVIGANDSITLHEAREDAKNAKPTARFNTNGIFVNGRPRDPGSKPHHIIIRNCSVSKCPGGGITVIEADHVTIEDNLVFENAWFMRFGGSGITFLNNWAHDEAPGYHVVIQRNKVWDNKTLVPWEKVGKLSDGNGILLDTTNPESGALNPNADAAVTSAAVAVNPAKPVRPLWTARALIANNLSAFNGGSGIHTFQTRHVDIINNTTYWNGQTVAYQEVFANRSHDVVILNNIIVPRPGGQVTSNNKNTDVIWDYNLYPIDQHTTAHARDVVTGPNDLVTDPLFKKVHADLSKADFTLRKGSPAIGSGTDTVPQAVDLRGVSRPAGSGRDRGAYEQ